MQHYDPYRRSPRRQPTRTLTIDQIKQIEATLQELEREAAQWKDLARKWETTANEEYERASQLEEQLQEQQENIRQVGISETWLNLKHSIGIWQAAKQRPDSKTQRHGDQRSQTKFEQRGCFPVSRGGRPSGRR